MTLSLETLPTNANCHALSLQASHLWRQVPLAITQAACSTSPISPLNSVETGAEVSLLPLKHQQLMHLQQPTHMHSYRKHHPQEGFSLQAANSSSIPTYGRQSLTLNLGLRRIFPWIFIADVHQPIIGADFRNHFNLLVEQVTS